MVLTKFVIGLFCALAVLIPITAGPGNVPLVIKATPGLLVNDEGRWISVSKGIEFRTIALQRGEENQPMELKMLRFNAQQVVPRVLSSAQFQMKGANARLFVEKTGAIAAINANYFDEQGKP